MCPKYSNSCWPHAYLLALAKKMMLPQNLQGLFNMHHMHIPSRTIYKNIIEKNQNKLSKIR